MVGKTIGPSRSITFIRTVSKRPVKRAAERPESPARQFFLRHSTTTIERFRTFCPERDESAKMELLWWRAPSESCISDMVTLPQGGWWVLKLAIPMERIVCFSLLGLKVFNKNESDKIRTGMDTFLVLRIRESIRLAWLSGSFTDSERKVRDLQKGANLS